MMALVFTVQADANGYSAAVDAKLGYPKPGVDIGGGIHVPPAQSVTVRYGNVFPHPTLPQWMYPDNPTQPSVEPNVTKQVPVPVTASEQTIDATWFPTAVAVP